MLGRDRPPQRGPVVGGEFLVLGDPLPGIRHSNRIASHTARCGPGLRGQSSAAILGQFYVTFPDGSPAPAAAVLATASQATPASLRGRCRSVTKMQAK
jgi:hypothetical protein